MNHSNVEAKISRADLTDVSLLEHARLGDGAAFELIVRLRYFVRQEVFLIMSI